MILTGTRKLIKINIVESSSGGHWITLTDIDGISTHVFITGGSFDNGHWHGGRITKGPKGLIGADMNHLPEGPHRTKHHSEGHTPEGHNKHPDYAEHQEKIRVFGKHGPGHGYLVNNPLPNIAPEEHGERLRNAFARAREQHSHEAFANGSAGRADTLAHHLHNEIDAALAKKQINIEEYNNKKRSVDFSHRQARMHEKTFSDSYSGHHLDLENHLKSMQDKYANAPGKSKDEIAIEKGKQKLAILDTHKKLQADVEAMHMSSMQKSTALKSLVGYTNQALNAITKDEDPKEALDGMQHFYNHIKNNYAKGTEDDYNKKIDQIEQVHSQIIDNLAKMGMDHPDYNALAQKGGKLFSQATKMADNGEDITPQLAEMGLLSYLTGDAAKTQQDNDNKDEEKNKLNAISLPLIAATNGDYTITSEHKQTLTKQIKDLHNKANAAIDKGEDPQKYIDALYNVDIGPKNEDIDDYKAKYDNKEYPIDSKELRNDWDTAENTKIEDILNQAIADGVIDSRTAAAYRGQHAQYPSLSTRMRILQKLRAHKELRAASDVHPELSTPYVRPHEEGETGHIGTMGQYYGMHMRDNDLNPMKVRDVAQYFLNDTAEHQDPIKLINEHLAKLDRFKEQGEINEDEHVNVMQSLLKRRKFLQKQAEENEAKKEAALSVIKGVTGPNAIIPIVTPKLVHGGKPTPTTAKAAYDTCKKLKTAIPGKQPGEYGSRDILAKKYVARQVGKELKNRGISTEEANNIYHELNLEGYEESDPHERLAAGLVHEWANSSGDTRVNSLLIQHAADTVFGTNLWGNKKPEHCKDEYTWNKVLEYTKNPKIYGVMKHFIESQYKLTQNMFKERGIKNITVFRGMGVRDPKYVEYVNSQPLGYDQHIKYDAQPGEVTLNPVNSCGLNAQAALKFFSHGSDSSDSGKSKRVILMGHIPVEHIVGSFRSGNGCMVENEVVITGHQFPWKVVHASSLYGVTKYLQDNKLDYGPQYENDDSTYIYTV